MQTMDHLSGYVNEINLGHQWQKDKGEWNMKLRPGVMADAGFAWVGCDEDAQADWPLVLAFFSETEVVFSAISPPGRHVLKLNIEQHNAYWIGVYSQYRRDL